MYKFFLLFKKFCDLVLNAVIASFTKIRQNIECYNTFYQKKNIYILRLYIYFLDFLYN